MNLGDLKIYYLDGGMTNMDGGTMFGPVPKVLWSRKLKPNDKNQVRMSTHPILIIAKDKNILIDSGLGMGKLTDKQKQHSGVENESYVKENLAAYNLTPEDIDIVLMTHMHFDHAAGLADNDGHAQFPNAVHYIQQDEWQEFLAPNLRSKATYWPQNQGDYQEHMILFENEIEPYPGIKMQHTGGHSYGHSIITIESNGERAVHMADIFPSHAHFNPLWVTAYDDYPMQSIREKERLIPYFIYNDFWFLFYHDADYFAIKYDSQQKTIQSAIKR
ncbi:metallo-beta-lactamase superfamily protein [Staphylococcus piscifermentans]|uniref:MBL fold metallo-hydrolase n=1 Tax=Staphylococcus piscifermentans TaxID=70258 RepID=A0A239TZS3_9STAP|nr:MBL fold metallo-hydrolase [Staphylococcus piscifermentans]RTX83601.1 MBL fold metallo-hydrolase [Staphylococcus piscifermentans]GEP84352.1 MBL fold metallo-hydrolase [Staphylococcus piscifermentans]SNV03095.1 metallo-beta-lactamase superfamily protein [Staphylococcus piscifermentans]